MGCREGLGAPTPQSRAAPSPEMGVGRPIGQKWPRSKVLGGIFVFDPLQLGLCNLIVHFLQFHLTAVSQIGARAAGGNFHPPPGSQGSWLPTQLLCCPKYAILQPYSSGNLVVKGRRLLGGGPPIEGTSEL